MHRAKTPIVPHKTDLNLNASKLLCLKYDYKSITACLPNVSYARSDIFSSVRFYYACNLTEEHDKCFETFLLVFSVFFTLRNAFIAYRLQFKRCDACAFREALTSSSPISLSTKSALKYRRKFYSVIRSFDKKKNCAGNH
jgi:hypothetical protein